MNGILLDAVVKCFGDPKPGVKYAAIEAMYNILKALRGKVLPFLFPIF